LGVVESITAVASAKTVPSKILLASIDQPPIVPNVAAIPPFKKALSVYKP